MIVSRLRSFRFMGMPSVGRWWVDDIRGCLR